MNVFVLSTGRCGSETFTRACGHITNYTASHESQAPWKVPGRTPYRSLRYPDNHIEVDNRLSWFLGTLEKEYGNRAYYVHLLRRREEVARSLMSRGESSILFSFASGVLQLYDTTRDLTSEQRYEIGLQYCDTINDNIALFLRDKTKRLTIKLHDVDAPFKTFWREIGAEGDLRAASAEWGVRHNASGQRTSPREWTERIQLATEELATVVPADVQVILVDEGQFAGSDLLKIRSCIPFPERDHVYWGPPADDAEAVIEFERLTEEASFIAFAWMSFWWLDFYTGLHQRLLSQHRRVMANDRWIVFELNSPKHQ